jgi:hypothetical protein
VVNILPKKGRTMASNETISVYFEPLGTFNGLNYFHETIVYTNSSGQNFFLTSGPTIAASASGSNVIGALSDEIANTPSAFGVLFSPGSQQLTSANAVGITQSSSGVPFTSTVVDTGTDLSAVYQTMVNEEQSLNGQNLTYSPLTQNSNSYATTALMAAGVTPPAAGITSGFR